MGDTAILKTTEILEETSTGIWKVHRAPDLPKPLFGHCIAMLRNGRVVLSGGFDGNDQSDISEEFEWLDNFSGKWSTKEWSALNANRYDHGCFSKGGRIELVGGWSADLSQKLATERYDQIARKWQKISSDTTNSNVDSALPYILRSATLGVSEGNVALIGGVSCELESGSLAKTKCIKHKEVYELQLNVDLNVTQWKKTTNEIGLARSSHVSINVPKSIEFSCSPVV